MPAAALPIAGAAGAGAGGIGSIFGAVVPLLGTVLSAALAPDPPEAPSPAPAPEAPPAPVAPEVKEPEGTLDADAARTRAIKRRKEAATKGGIFKIAGESEEAEVSVKSLLGG